MHYFDGFVIVSLETKFSILVSLETKFDEKLKFED